MKVVGKCRALTLREYYMATHPDVRALRDHPCDYPGMMCPLEKAQRSTRSCRIWTTEAGISCWDQITSVNGKIPVRRVRG